MNCPECNGEMDKGAMYVRGLGGSLFWSTFADRRWFSRKHLEQMDLSKMSLAPTGGQAVFESWRCRCGMITFKAHYIQR